MALRDLVVTVNQKSDALDVAEAEYKAAVDALTAFVQANVAFRGLLVLGSRVYNIAPDGTVKLLGKATVV